MKIVEIIIDLVKLLCCLAPAVIAVVALIKNIIKDKNWKAIQPIVLSAMTAAEAYAVEHPEMTGEDKLNMALAAIKNGLAAADIAFDETLITRIVSYINELCDWSKTVNAK